MRDVQGSATEKLKMFEKVRAAGGFAKGDLADHAEAERMLRDFVRWRRGMPKGGEPVPLYRKTPLASATLRLSYLSTMRLSSLRLWPAMAAISGTVQPAPAIRVTHVPQLSWMVRPAMPALTAFRWNIRLKLFDFHGSPWRSKDCRAVQEPLEWDRHFRNPLFDAISPRHCSLNAR